MNISPARVARATAAVSFVGGCIFFGLSILIAVGSCAPVIP